MQSQKQNNEDGLVTMSRIYSDVLEYNVATQIRNIGGQRKHRR